MVLEEDVVDSSLADYKPVVYFLSDGNPNSGHSATDVYNWPSSWGAWQDFIDDPLVNGPPDSNANFIETFPVSIAPSINAAQVVANLEPVGNDGDTIIEVEVDLSNLSDLLLETVPAGPTDTVTRNDIPGANCATVTEIAFETADATQYIIDNDLGGISYANGTTVHIPVPQDGSEVEFITPLGAGLAMDKTGEYTYTVTAISHDVTEEFAYTYSKIGNPSQFDTAILTINALDQPASLLTLVGTSGNDTLSNEGTDEDIITMEGKGGIDEFTVDVNELVENEIILIKDLGLNGQNKLTFINVDAFNDGVAGLSFADVVQSFTQYSRVNANVEVITYSGVVLIFENIGTVYRFGLPALQDHIEQITAELNVQS